MVKNHPTYVMTKLQLHKTILSKWSDWLLGQIFTPLKAESVITALNWELELWELHLLQLEEAKVATSLQWRINHLAEQVGCQDPAAKLHVLRLGEHVVHEAAASTRFTSSEGIRHDAATRQRQWRNWPLSTGSCYQEWGGGARTGSKNRTHEREHGNYTWLVVCLFLTRVTETRLQASVQRPQRKHGNLGWRGRVLLWTISGSMKIKWKSWSWKCDSNSTA